MSTRALTTSATTALAGSRLCVYPTMSAGAVFGTAWHVASTTIPAGIVNAKRHSRRPEEVASQP